MRLLSYSFYLLKISLLVSIFGLLSCLGASKQQNTTKIGVDEQSDKLKSAVTAQVLENSRNDTIEIYGLNILDIPEQIFTYPNTKYLRIDCASFDCMTTLTSRISELKELEGLVLTKSALHKLPPEIGQLKKLKELRVLGGGRLKTIPNELSELEELELLDLWRNKLTQLPPSITELKQLKFLYLGENDFSKPYLDSLKVSLPHVDIKMWR